MTRPYCIQIQPGQTSTPPYAGAWELIGNALYPADAATARGANLEFPRPAPDPVVAVVAASAPPATPAPK